MSRSSRRATLGASRWGAGCRAGRRARASRWARRRASATTAGRASARVRPRGARSRGLRSSGRLPRVTPGPARLTHDTLSLCRDHRVRDQRRRRPRRQPVPVRCERGRVWRAERREHCGASPQGRVERAGGRERPGQREPDSGQRAQAHGPLTPRGQRQNLPPWRWCHAAHRRRRRPSTSIARRRWARRWSIRPGRRSTRPSRLAPLCRPAC